MQSALTVNAGGQGLSKPFGVVVDAAGDVFIPDPNNGRVVEILAGGGKQTTVGTGGGTVQGETPQNDPGSSIGLSYQFEY